MVEYTFDPVWDIDYYKQEDGHRFRLLRSEISGIRITPDTPPERARQTWIHSCESEEQCGYYEPLSTHSVIRPP